MYINAVMIWIRLVYIYLFNFQKYRNILSTTDNTVAQYTIKSSVNIPFIGNSA